MKYKLYINRSSDSNQVKYKVEGPSGTYGKLESIYDFWDDNCFKFGLKIDGGRTFMEKKDGEFQIQYRDYEVLFEFNDAQELKDHFKLYYPEELELKLYKWNFELGTRTNINYEYLVLNRDKFIMVTDDLNDVLKKLDLLKFTETTRPVESFIEFHDWIGTFEDLSQLKNHIKTEMQEYLI